MKKIYFVIILFHIFFLQSFAQDILNDNFGPGLQVAGIDLMLSGHNHRNTFYEADKSGFGYPVLVNSNNPFVELVADTKEIKAVVEDVDGKVIADMLFNSNCNYILISNLDEQRRNN